jgi:hypothetical protein
MNEETGFQVDCVQWPRTGEDMNSTRQSWCFHYGRLLVTQEYAVEDSWDLLGYEPIS